MSKSFRYVKDFDFGMKCGGSVKKTYESGGKVKGKQVEKVAVKRKDSPGAVTREKSAMRMEQTEMRLPGNKIAPSKGSFNREPMIPMKDGGNAKVGKVMGEYKRGELHSGGKKGPEVTSKKQAIAIALSEARRAGKKK